MIERAGSFARSREFNILYVYFTDTRTLERQYFRLPGIVEIDSARLEPRYEMMLIESFRWVKSSCNLIAHVILFAEILDFFFSRTFPLSLSLSFSLSLFLSLCLFFSLFLLHNIVYLETRSCDMTCSTPCAHPLDAQLNGKTILVSASDSVSSNSR